MILFPSPPRSWQIAQLLRIFSIPFLSVSTSQLYVFMRTLLLENCCHRESIIINTKYKMWSVIAKEKYVMAWLPSAFAACTSREARSATIVFITAAAARSSSIRGLSLWLLLASDTTLFFSLVFLARWSPQSCTVMLGVHMKYIQLCSLYVDLFVCAAVESL